MRSTLRPRGWPPASFPSAVRLRRPGEQKLDSRVAVASCRFFVRDAFQISPVYRSQQHIKMELRLWHLRCIDDLKVLAAVSRSVAITGNAVTAHTTESGNRANAFRTTTVVKQTPSN